MKLSEYLELAFSRINTEEKWTKHYAAVNRDGKRVPPTSFEACRFCSIGAMRVATDDTDGVLVDRMINVLESIIQKTGYSTRTLLSWYNDASDYEQIVALWAAGIAKAKQQELNTI